MKNKEFFYLQYDKVNWQNQEKTKINSFVNDFIIKEIILKKKGSNVKIFDIGFGIGFFLWMLEKNLPKSFKDITLEGCEPSYKNYKYFKQKPFDFKKIKLRTFNNTFLETKTEVKFDFLTAVYVFPHFEFDELEETAEKINGMLNGNGKFILVVANEKYLKEKLKAKKDLFIEENTIKFNGKDHQEILHYSEVPQIGTIIDYNREEKFYVELFKEKGFNLESKIDLDDSGFICTVFVFGKN